MISMLVYLFRKGMLPSAFTTKVKILCSISVGIAVPQTSASMRLNVVCEGSSCGADFNAAVFDLTSWLPFSLILYCDR